MSTATAVYLQINRQDHDEVQLHGEALPTLAPGEALLRVESFALTANNITYAEFGDALHYWRFFPAPGGWGRLPVWGFAEVIATNSAHAPLGQRYYGYYPAGSHLRVQPQAMGAAGFIDAAAHRARLPVIYNQYLACATTARSDADAAATAHGEALEALLRPLFTTSFLIAQSLLDRQCFAASSAVLSSASSKTAVGTAYLMRELGVPLRRIGLSASANQPFLRGLGLYDELLDYPHLEGLATLGETVSIDFAGSRQVLGEIHERLGSHLRHSWLVGGAHWQARAALTDESRARDGSSGPRPEVFFAPSVAEHYLRQWGGAAFQRRVAALWQGYLDFARRWLEVVEMRGVGAIGPAYAQVRGNRIPAQQGLIIRL